MLERRFPHEFGSRVMLGGIPDGDPIRLDATDAIRESPEASKRLHEVMILAAEAARGSTRSPKNTDEDGDPEL